jgi:metal-responsive CopG/Arc/MetJ family transcriptional regulator
MTRISITIPEELVDAADREAASLDRSRSWVLVEALRRYLSRPEGLVREGGVAYMTGLGELRAAQLEADLRLTPEERVIEAERTLHVDTVRRGSGKPQQDRVLTFDRYEDYLDWKRRDAIRP